MFKAQTFGSIFKKYKMVVIETPLNKYPMAIHEKARNLGFKWDRKIHPEGNEITLRKFLKFSKDGTMCYSNIDSSFVQPTYHIEIEDFLALSESGSVETECNKKQGVRQKILEQGLTKDPYAPTDKDEPGMTRFQKKRKVLLQAYSGFLKTYVAQGTEVGLPPINEISQIEEKDPWIPSREVVMENIGYKPATKVFYECKHSGLNPCGCGKTGFKTFAALQSHVSEGAHGLLASSFASKFESTEDEEIKGIEINMHGTDSKAVDRVHTAIAGSVTANVNADDLVIERRGVPPKCVVTLGQRLESKKYRKD